MALASSQKRQRLSTRVQDEDGELSENIVNAAVKSILMLDQNKKLIKQSEIMHGLPEKLKKKQITELWKKVHEALESLGMKIIEYEEAQTKSFFLAAKDDSCAPFLYKYAIKEERAFRTLVVIVLAFILMKDNLVNEDELMRHLKKLNLIHDTGDSHQYFGDVKKKVFTEFVEQLYVTRIAATGGETVKLCWGPRAQVEVSSMEILEFVCRTAYKGEVEPEQWAAQYKRACEQMREQSPVPEESDEQE